MSKTCVKQCYGFATLYRERGEILNTVFKIPIIFCSLIVDENMVKQIIEKYKNNPIIFAIKDSIRLTINLSTPRYQKHHVT